MEIDVFCVLRSGQYSCDGTEEHSAPYAKIAGAYTTAAEAQKAAGDFGDMTGWTNVVQWVEGAKVKEHYEPIVRSIVDMAKEIVGLPVPSGLGSSDVDRVEHDTKTPQEKGAAQILRAYYEGVQVDDPRVRDKMLNVLSGLEWK
jgi:hypothetical protein